MPERHLGELLQLLFPDIELVDHPQAMPGKPDFWLPELQIALFCDGCFFHMCPQHFVMPEKNRDYWEPKIARNRERDRQVNKALKAAGIKVVRVWEHDLRKDVAPTRRRLQRIVRECRRKLIALESKEGEKV